MLEDVFHQDGVLDADDGFSCKKKNNCFEDLAKVWDTYDI
jgi:hypothetical protein